jgi:hypothetical protein
VERSEREGLEDRLISSYESYVALRHALYQARKRGSMVPGLYERIVQERQMQRFLHALLGDKGEPPGLLY